MPTVLGSSAPSSTPTFDPIYGMYAEGARFIRGADRNSFQLSWYMGGRPNAVGYINDAGTQGSVDFPDGGMRTFYYRHGMIYWDDDGSFSSTDTWTKIESLAPSTFHSSVPTVLGSSAPSSTPTFDPIYGLYAEGARFIRGADKNSFQLSWYRGTRANAVGYINDAGTQGSVDFSDVGTRTFYYRHGMIYWDDDGSFTSTDIWTKIESLAPSTFHSSAPTVLGSSAPSSTPTFDPIYGMYSEGARFIRGADRNSFQLYWYRGGRPNAVGYINDAGTQGSVDFPDGGMRTFYYRHGMIYWGDDGSFTSTDTWTKIESHAPSTEHSGVPTVLGSSVPSSTPTFDPIYGMYSEGARFIRGASRNSFQLSWYRGTRANAVGYINDAGTQGSVDFSDVGTRTFYYRHGIIYWDDDGSFTSTDTWTKIESLAPSTFHSSVPTVSGSSSPSSTPTFDPIFGMYSEGARFIRGADRNSFQLYWYRGGRPNAVGYINDAGTQGSVDFPDGGMRTFYYRHGMIYWGDDGSFTSTDIWTKIESHAPSTSHSSVPTVSGSSVPSSTPTFDPIFGMYSEGARFIRGADRNSFQLYWYRGTRANAVGYINDAGTQGSVDFSDVGTRTFYYRHGIIYWGDDGSFTSTDIWTKIESHAPSISHSSVPTTVPTSLPTLESSLLPTAVPSNLGSGGPSSSPTFEPIFGLFKECDCMFLRGADKNFFEISYYTGNSPNVRGNINDAGTQGSVDFPDGGMRTFYYRHGVIYWGDDGSFTSTDTWTKLGSLSPSSVPSGTPTLVLSTSPTDLHSGVPTSLPTEGPTPEPTNIHSVNPTSKPTSSPTFDPIFGLFIGGTAISRGTDQNSIKIVSVTGSSPDYTGYINDAGTQGSVNFQGEGTKTFYYKNGVIYWNDDGSYTSTDTWIKMGATSNASLASTSADVSQQYGSCPIVTCDPNFIVNGNAEASVDPLGWTPRLGGSLSIRNEGADGTLHSFEHSGRSSFIMGPMHDLPSECFIHGLRYQFDAKIKLIDENGIPFECDKEHVWTEEYACPLLTFQLDTPEGMKWLYYGNLAPGAWNVHGWNNFKTYIDANDDIAAATGGYLYIERPRAGITLIVDEIIVSRDCTTLVTNNNGETGSLSGWFPMFGSEGETLIRTGGANGSNNAIVHTKRSTSASGPGHYLDVGCLVENTPYAFTGRMKLLDEGNNDEPFACTKGAPPGSPDSCPVFVIQYTSYDGVVTTLELENEIPNEDQPWIADYFNPYLATFTVTSELADAACAHIMLKGPRAGASIVFDDLEIAVNYPVVPDCGEKMISNGDFDDGDMTGWTSVHGGQLSLMEEDNGYSLKLSNRANLMSAFSYELPTLCLIEGKEYEIKVDLKLMDGHGNYVGCDKTAPNGSMSSCPIVGVIFFTPYGTILHQPPNENGSPWDADGCNSFNSVFTITSEMASATKAYFNVWGASQFYSIIIDNLYFRAHKLFMHDCRQLVRNTNAESGVSKHWTVHGLGNLQSIDGGYCSPHAFGHFGRTLPWMGPMQELEVSCLTEGLVYDFNAQLKLLDASGDPVACDKNAEWLAPDYCPILMFLEEPESGNATRSHIANDYGGAWIADSFNAFKARITITTAMATASKLSMYFQGPGANISIIFDDVTMHQVFEGSAM